MHHAGTRRHHAMTRLSILQNARSAGLGVMLVGKGGACRLARRSGGNREIRSIPFIVGAAKAGMGGCCANQRHSVAVQDSFEAVLPDECFVHHGTTATRRCEPSSVEEYEAFMKMKTAALQEKGLIARLPAAPEC